MFLLDWYRDWLSIRSEFKKSKLELTSEEKVCQSCETLRQQLEIANYEKGELLKRLLKEPEPVKENTEGPAISIPRVVPWRVRQQMLEREDREKARILRNAPKPDAETEKKSIEELEKEMDVAATQREQEQSSR